MNTPPNPTPANHSRYGLAEPATFVCMAVLLWPCIGGDLGVIEQAFTGWSSWPGAVSVNGHRILCVASVLMLGYRIAIAYIVAFAVCSFIHRDVRAISLPRIHLATGLLVMFAASLIVGIVIALHPTIFFGVPPNYLYIAVTIWASTPPALAVLLGVSFASEAWIKRKLPPAIPLQTPGPPEPPPVITFSPFSPAWLSGEPTTRDRVLFALPLIALFLMGVIGFWSVDALNLRALRVDLPPSSRLIFYFTGHPERFFATLLLVGGVYVAWICRSRRRMVIFAVIVTAALLLGLFMLLLTLISPLIDYAYPCVVEGESVDTPGGPQPIEQLRVDSAVFCQSPAGETVPGRVQAIYINTVEAYLSLEFTDGSRLNVTAAHPLATPHGYQPAGTLRSGSAVVARSGTRVIRSISVREEREKVYDLSVTPHPNFFASGVLVHNKLRKK